MSVPFACQYIYIARWVFDQTWGAVPVSVATVAAAAVVVVPIASLGFAPPGAARAAPKAARGTNAMLDLTTGRGLKA
jgi:hypothetical protein